MKSSPHILSRSPWKNNRSFTHEPVPPYGGTVQDSAPPTERNPVKREAAAVRRRSFTLVEIVVAATIFSIIAAGIGASLVSGIKIWGRARTGDIAKADFLLALEKFSEELRGSLDIGSVGFKGSASEVSFPALGGNAISNIVYRFDAARNMLVRAIRPITEKEMVEPDEDEGVNKEEEANTVVTEKDILALTGLSFEYFYIDKLAEPPAWKWTDVWEKKNGIFAAIRLRGRHKDEEFTKIVFIPVS